jgi:hypothetical protein
VIIPENTQKSLCCRPRHVVGGEGGGGRGEGVRLRFLLGATTRGAL